MYTNADITLYSYVDNKYIRKVIKDVFWNEVKESNTLKSGLNTADSVKIFVPLKNMPVTKITTGKDIIVKGVIEFEVDNTSQATQSASLNQLKKDFNGNCLVAMLNIWSSAAYKLSCGQDCSIATEIKAADLIIKKRGL